jgi:hypothetical protein
MDAARVDEYEKTPIRIGDRIWDAEVRGGLIALKGRLKYPKRTGGGKRRAIRSFSRQSRFRMFKMIASIDWQCRKRGLFITLTFPDEVMPVAKERRMRALAEFFRQVEAFLGCEVSALWRCEWEERLSGTHKGMYLPHYHLIVFDVRYIPYKMINLFWQRAINWTGYVRTEVKRLATKKAHGIYIAKYCAKVPHLSSLVSVAYSRIDGKHWGYYRRKKLPRATQWYFEDISLSNVMTLRDLASSALTWYDQETDAGFTVFGKFGEKMAQSVLNLLLDTETPNG